MCDIYQENVDKMEGNIAKSPVLNQHIPVSNNFLTNTNDINESSSLRSESPFSFTNQPSPTFFLQNFNFSSFPSLDYAKNKHNQIKSKSLRFLKVTNDLANKISLLEEIYDGMEYKRRKMSNKLIECRLDEEASHKLVARLVSQSNNENSSLCDRTVHPAYSTEEHDDELTMDSSGLFKVPSTPTFFSDPPMQDTYDYDALQSYTNEPEPRIPQSELEPLTETNESLFLEHEGNTYIRVDDTNYHLVQSLSEDGVIITETGLQIIIPDGTEVPMNNALNPPLQPSPIPIPDNLYHNNYNTNNHPMINNDYFQHDKRTMSTNHKSTRHDINPYYGHLSYQTGSAVKPYSDYVALPVRPAPTTPFTLSSQLYTPELSISLTEQECELMLTIDSMKRALPQQAPIYYQIYSYKDDDRYAKPTSEVWSLVGEIKSCALPMFCTISIPSGYHKHYFAIRSVDELCRFSDWSNVVQVEVESSNGGGSVHSPSNNR